MVAPPETASTVPQWKFTMFDKEEMTEMKIKTVGIDLAKNVFQAPGVDECGKVGSEEADEGCSGTT